MPERIIGGGVDVRLVVTHRDSATETIWWQSVAGLAGHAGIPVIMPDDPNDPEVVSRVDDCAPDFIFSFYYRHLLTLDMLNVPNRGRLICMAHCCPVTGEECR